MADDRIPVTILSGPLGAGKTTVLTHVLSNPGERRIAVLVNDVGELNVDAELIERGTDLSVASDGLAELSNGCICCELQDDLETEVLRLARIRDFDHLIVESSGISEPAPVARLFETESSAAAVYEVDTLVTVVDGVRLPDLFDPDGAIERTAADEGEPRPLSELVVEQIEFCDVLLLNKCDLLSDEELDRIETILRTLHPEAHVIRTIDGNVDPDEILDTERFSIEQATEAAAWRRALEAAHNHHDNETGHDHHDHHPEAVYGIDTVTYRRRRPFHPERFAAFLERLPEWTIRSKGRFWVAGHDETALLVSQVGSAVTVEATDRWIASLPEIERELFRENRPELDWHDRWGDREIALVFIGQQLDSDALVDRLDACLMTDDELEQMIDEQMIEVDDTPFPTEGTWIVGDEADG